MRVITLTTLAVIFPSSVLAQPHGGHHGAPLSAYAGEETRLIKSLSVEDLEGIAAGGGWGLARAAELNGVPGPTHLLELAEALRLTEEQRDSIEAIRLEMQAEAILAGTRFVDAERQLDRAFQGGALDLETLELLVMQAGEARAVLRLAHLRAHLRTLPLLTQDQVSRYATLRGYSEDPCSTVPDGHDPKMWRRHNGCN